MTMRREYRRTRISATESAELWERWKKGEGLHAIGQALGRGRTSLFAHIRPSGGIKPPARRRSVRALTMAEREEISRGIVGGLSVRAIARALNRSASTVSREILRNGGLRRYRAEAADKLAWKRTPPARAALWAGRCFVMLRA
jgi:DNA-binding NarL/FixJ family response regulator